MTDWGEKRGAQCCICCLRGLDKDQSLPPPSLLSVPAKNISFSGLRVAAFDLRATPGPVRQQWRQSSWRGAPVVGGAACGWAAAAGMNEQPSAERSALSVEQGPRIPSLFNPSRCTSTANCHPLNPYTKRVYIHCQHRFEALLDIECVYGHVWIQFLGSTDNELSWRHQTDKKMDKKNLKVQITRGVTTYHIAIYRNKKYNNVYCG